MLQNTNISNGNKIKQVIKGQELPALAALAAFKPLPANASYQDKKAVAEPLKAAINEYRQRRGYDDNAAIEGQMYFLLQGDTGRGDYSDELRMMRETLIELMAALAHPDVITRLEGYTKNYAGGMLKRLYTFFKGIEGDWFLTYMDKQPFEELQDYTVEHINRKLSIYQHYSGTGPVYDYDAEGLAPKGECEG